MIWLSLAVAADFGLAAGVSHTANDPFQRVYTAEASGIIGLSDVFALEGRLAYSPDLAQGMSALAQQLTTELHISPDLSFPMWRAEVAGVFAPLHTRHGGWFGTAGVAVGAGVIQTRDDLEAIGIAGDETAIATEVEIHPTGHYGLHFEAMYGRVGFRVRTQTLFYVETIDSVVLENKRPRNVALEGVVRF